LEEPPENIFEVISKLPACHPERSEGSKKPRFFAASRLRMTEWRGFEIGSLYKQTYHSKANSVSWCKKNWQCHCNPVPA